MSEQSNAIIIIFFFLENAHIWFTFLIKNFRELKIYLCRKIYELSNTKYCDLF